MVGIKCGEHRVWWVQGQSWLHESPLLSFTQRLHPLPTKVPWPVEMYDARAQTGMLGGLSAPILEDKGTGCSRW